MQVSLAEALLRRKELQQKVAVLMQIKQSDLFYQIHAKRVKVSEGLDELSASYPKLEASQVIAEFDWHARQLRLVDASIQQANWTTNINVDDSVMGDYKA